MAYVDKINAGGELREIHDTAGRQMIAPIELTSTATAAHAKGEYFIYNDTLYEATSAIAVGGTITPNTNCTAVRGGVSNEFGGKISQLKSAIDYSFETGKNLIDPAKMVVGLISGSGGRIDVTSTSYKTTDFIPIASGQSITFSRTLRRFIAYNENKSAISASYQKDQMTYYTYTASANGFVRASYNVDYITGFAQAEYGTEHTTYEPYCYYLTSNVRFGQTQKQIISGVITDEVAKEINLVNSADFTTGIIDSSSGAISASGSSANYRTTDYIPIKNGQTIVFSPRIRKFLAFKANKTALTATYLNADTPNYAFTATEDGYVRASFYVDYSGVAQAEYATVPSTFIEYGDRRLNGGIVVPADNIENLVASNNINGKKWCACGDSFTQGDFTGLQESEYKLQSGRYVGKNAVYPYIIGNKDNMNIVNLAIGGMTMCCIDGTRQNSFTYNEYYKQIPLDSDYITLKFGINDNNYSSPIGTIDDNTIETFYGAWNVVLDWITENFPTQKIGIIITNGITDNAGQAYLEATRAVAQKWGIPYLDEVDDVTVPLLLRVKRTGLSDTVYNRKLATFRVSETNLHPNPACHYYESTIVESWLNSL